MKTISKTLIIVLSHCVIASGLTAAEDAKISLQPNCKTFYAGREHTLTVKTQRLTGERLSWNLRYAGRTLASGQRQVPQNGEVKITFKFPELNEGVIAEVEFSCFTGESKVGRSEGWKVENRELKRTLYFFYPNPFKNQKEALQLLKIGIWEPSEGEALSGLLESYEIPFEKIADPASFDGKVLLVSGVDFDEFPGVNETLLKLVKDGKKVIILQPFTGTFAKFAENTDGVRLEKSILAYNQGGDTSIKISKKLDTENWNGKPIANKSMKLIAVDDWIGLEVFKLQRAKAEIDNPGTPSPSSGIIKTEGPVSGFTYCEVRKGKGSMIITTWNIIKGTKESPTPVYLLKEMLIK